jgi:hypothetical protein
VAATAPSTELEAIAALRSPITKDIRLIDQPITSIVKDLLQTDRVMFTPANTFTETLTLVAPVARGGDRWDLLSTLAEVYSFTVHWRPDGTWNVARSLIRVHYKVHHMDEAQAAAAVETIRYQAALVSDTSEEPQVEFDAQSRAFIVSARPKSQDAVRQYLAFADVPRTFVAIEVALCHGKGIPHTVSTLDPAATRDLLETLRKTPGVSVRSSKRTVRNGEHAVFTLPTPAQTRSEQASVIEIEAKAMEEAVLFHYATFIGLPHQGAAIKIRTTSKVPNGHTSVMQWPFASGERVLLLMSFTPTQAP